MTTIIKETINLFELPNNTCYHYNVKAKNTFDL